VPAAVREATAQWRRFQSSSLGSAWGREAWNPELKDEEEPASQGEVWEEGRKVSKKSCARQQHGGKAHGFLEQLGNAKQLQHLQPVSEREAEHPGHTWAAGLGGLDSHPRDLSPPTEGCPT
jgi:hypothetical protein